MAITTKGGIMKVHSNDEFIGEVYTHYRYAKDTDGTGRVIIQAQAHRSYSWKEFETVEAAVEHLVKEAEAV